MARTGKIARLPLAIRDELNMRLLDNENGQTILAWLNAQPVVVERIQGDWKGEPVNDANLSKGLLAANVGKIQKALEQFWDGLRDINSTEEGNDKDQAVTKLLSALTAIRSVELDEQKLDLKRVEIAQKGETLELERAKFRRATAELFCDYCADERAKTIALGDATKDNKVAQLIQLWFGEMPENIGPAGFRKPAGAAAKP